jgi:hypothetical protein
LRESSSLFSLSGLGTKGLTPENLLLLITQSWVVLPAILFVLLRNVRTFLLNILKTCTKHFGTLLMQNPKREEIKKVGLK